MTDHDNVRLKNNTPTTKDSSVFEIEGMNVGTWEMFTLRNKRVRVVCAWPRD